MLTTVKTIAIVGLGVIGGSFAKAIKLKLPNLYTVIGIDSDENTIVKAVAEGWIDNGTSGDAGKLLQDADLIIICLYPSLVIDFVKKYKDNFKKGAILTDVTGVKSVLIDELKRVVPEHIDFILGHPMAGSEKSGLLYAREDMFTNANYVLTPDKNNKTTHVEWLAEFVKQIGFKRVTLTTPVHHDEMIAHTSQLSHLLSVAFINSDICPEETASFVGNSYRELTRIANINGPLWSELFIANKDILIPIIERFQQELSDLKEAISQEDNIKMIEKFAESSKRRQGLEHRDM